MADEHVRKLRRRPIIFYIGAISPGGAERVIVNLANSFSIRGYNVDLVTDSAKAPDEYVLGPSVRRVSLDREGKSRTVLGQNLSRIARLRGHVRRRGPAVVVSFLPEPNFRSIIATMGLRCRTIISVRNDPNREYKSITYRGLALLLYGFASRVIFQTTVARDMFPTHIRRKSAIILNQIDERFFAVTPRQGAADIISVGRLSEQKNHSMTLRAFALIASDYPGCMLRIYGEGEDKDVLAELARRLGLEKRVKFMGISGDMPRELSSARLFVLSSIYEGLPNALMEAMAVGLPIVSTDCPCGGPRMLLEGGHGLLVPVGGVREMSNAVKHLLDMPDYAWRVGASARRQSARFKPATVFARWESCIAEDG